MRRHYSTEQYAVYKQEAAEEFWGQVRCRTQLILAAVAGGRFRAADGRLSGAGALRTQREPRPAGGQPQWLLRAGLCDGAGIDSHAGAAHAQAFLPAARDRQRCSGARRRWPR
jgi:hypothetical protein